MVAWSRSDDLRFHFVFSLFFFIFSGHHLGRRNAIFICLPADVRIRYGPKVNDKVPIRHCELWT